jgi:hypothetical protein
MPQKLERTIRSPKAAPNATMPSTAAKGIRLAVFGRLRFDAYMSESWLVLPVRLVFMEFVEPVVSEVPIEPVEPYLVSAVAVPVAGRTVTVERRLPLPVVVGEYAT